MLIFQFSWINKQYYSYINECYYGYIHSQTRITATRASDCSTKQTFWLLLNLNSSAAISNTSSMLVTTFKSMHKTFRKIQIYKLMAS